MKHGKARQPERTAADPDSKYKVEAVARAALVLEALRTQSAPSSAAELAKAIGLGRSITTATLTTLQKHGLVRSAPVTGAAAAAEAEAEGYELGLVWLRLADVKRQQLDIREIALPVMRRVRDTVNETVSLSIRIGGRRINIEYAEGHHEVRRITQPGYHVPLHIGAAGRILTAALEDQEIAAYLAKLKTTEPQLAQGLSKTRLMREVEAARRDGHAVVAGEITSDTAAVSAPIRNHVGDVVAAITISCPEDRFGPQIQGRFIKYVVAAAREISTALGHDQQRAGKTPRGKAVTPVRSASRHRSAATAKQRAPKRTGSSPKPG